MAHTPGPWHIEPTSIGPAIVAYNRYTVAHVRLLVGNAEPQTDANARLIATAPTMKIVLEEARAALNQLGSDHGDELVMLIDRVLALATGKEG